MIRTNGLEFSDRAAIGGDGLVQRLDPRRPARPLPQRSQGNAEVVLGRRPGGGRGVAGVDLQRRALGGDGLVQRLDPRRPARPGS
jgi:hypothetical protein